MAGPGYGESIKNPDGYLLCYKAKAASGEGKHLRRAGVYVANQFGAEQLDTLKENEFCVPTRLLSP